METILKRPCLSMLVAVVFVICSASAFAQEEGNQQKDSLVGRISHIEGQLLRYVPDEDDWVLTEKDTPFGEYDNIFSSEDGNVEIIMPNNTLARIGSDTQVQLIELTSEATEIDVSSGIARLYNKSSSGQIKATTPFGDVIMPPETVCDIYVHENQTEIVAIKGSVQFSKTGSETRHELIAGSSSIIATSEQIVASNHSAEPAWDDWNVDRDTLWTKQMQARGDSKKYLPESLQDNAYELDNNGRWERVYYEDAYRYFWRPAYVDADWTPFSSGRWITWHGEQTWVPYDSFGYVTHHYGNWVHAGSRWYWAPPVSSVMVGAGLPLMYIGMNWYPGRVAWVSSSISIGWIPLAPYEMYYSSTYWGPRCRVRYYNHYYKHNRDRYKHYKHARYIDHRRYKGSKNYRHAGLRKGRSDEKYRGSARFPEKMRRGYKRQKNHIAASNNSKYRGTLKKINLNRDKRVRQKKQARLSTNPFERRVTKADGNKHRAGKTVYKNMPSKVVKNNKKVQKRQTLAKTKQINRFAKAHTQKRKKSVIKAKRSLQQPSKKVAGNRKKLQASGQGSQGKTRQKVVTVRQNKSNRNRIAKNTNTGARVQSKRSSRTYQAQRSNNTTRVGNSYAGSTSRQSSRQSRTGRTQNYASRGRRW